MKKIICLFALVILVSGCATYSKVFISPTGEMQRCGAWGNGLAGISQANQIQNDCISSMRSVGYIEIEKAGVIGIATSESGGDKSVLIIIKVTPNSPAFSAGIRAGDILVSVDNQKVNKTADARLLMFGLAGTQVAVTVMRGSELINLNLTRAPFKDVFGQ